MTFKSITSYTNDRTAGVRFAGGDAHGQGHPAHPVRASALLALQQPAGDRRPCYTNPDYLPASRTAYSYYYYTTAGTRSPRSCASRRADRPRPELGGRHLFQRLRASTCTGPSTQREQHLAGRARRARGLVHRQLRPAGRARPGQRGAATSTSGRVDVSDRKSTSRRPRSPLSARPATTSPPSSSSPPASG